MKFAHKLTLALLVVLAVVLSLCNTVLIGQQFRHCLLYTSDAADE